MTAVWNIFDFIYDELLCKFMNKSINISYETSCKYNLWGNILNKNGNQHLQNVIMQYVFLFVYLIIGSDWKSCFTI
jgi:hypothetical protein